MISNISMSVKLLLLVIEAFTHYTFDYSTILFLGSVLVRKLRSSSISGLPLIAKEVPLCCNQYILSILNPSNYILIRWGGVAILYHMWFILRLWKTWFFFILFQLCFRNENHSIGVVLLGCLFKDFTHIAIFFLFFMDFIKTYAILVKSLHSDTQNNV